MDGEREMEVEGWVDFYIGGCMGRWVRNGEITGYTWGRDGGMDSWGYMEMDRQIFMMDRCAQ